MLILMVTCMFQTLIIEEFRNSILVVLLKECGDLAYLMEVNEAEGRAVEIERVAEATAKGIREIAAAINAEGGMNAVNLRVAEQYINEFGNLAKQGNSLIIPADLSDMAGMIASAMTVIKEVGKEKGGKAAE